MLEQQINRALYNRCTAWGNLRQAALLKGCRGDGLAGRCCIISVNNQRTMIVLLRCRFYFTQLAAGLPAAIVAPSGRTEQVAHFFLQANVFTPAIRPDISPLVENNVCRGMVAQVGSKAVLQLLIVFSGQFGLESAKHFVPDNKKHAHVLIEVFGVGGMVYAVVRGCYQYIFQPTQFVYFFGMYQYAPNLCGGIYKCNIKRLKTAEGNRYKINKPVQWFHYGRTKTHCKIKFLRRMMGYMGGPEKADMVICAVQPVVHKIFCYEQSQPI